MPESAEELAAMDAILLKLMSEDPTFGPSDLTPEFMASILGGAKPTETPIKQETEEKERAVV